MIGPGIDLQLFLAMKPRANAAAIAGGSALLRWLAATMAAPRLQVPRPRRGCPEGSEESPEGHVSPGRSCRSRYSHSGLFARRPFSCPGSVQAHAVGAGEQQRRRQVTSA